MLTDKEIQNAKPRAKLYRLADGDGLTWRYRQPEANSGASVIVSAGKKRCWPSAAIPTCADRMRKRAGEARQSVQSGRDPSAEKKARRNTPALPATRKLSRWRARGWRRCLESSQSTKAKQTIFLEGDVFP